MQKQQPYRYLEHTADVEFVAYGQSTEVCFSNALMALFDTISYKNKVVASKGKVVTISVKDKAKNIEDLLWYMLQDAVSIADSKSLFAYRVQSLKISKSKGGYAIDAKISAKARVERASKLDVKGVSRYNLKVKEMKKGTEATVVLDV